MTPEQFLKWRDHCNLTQIGAARALGMSASGVRKLERGEAPVRKPVRLACAALAIGIKDYHGPKED